MSSAINLKIFSTSILAISSGIVFALGYLEYFDLSAPNGFYRAATAAISGTSILVTLFLWQGWKLPIFRGWLVKLPNLSGTWSGQIKSDWINPETNKGIDPIPASFTIKQSLFTASCMMRTGAMESFSISTGFEGGLADHVIKLIFTYRSDPKISVSNRSAIHHGTAILEFKHDEGWILEGRYFTERKTVGEMTFSFEKRKIRKQLNEKELSHPLAN